MMVERGKGGTDIMPETGTGRVRTYSPGLVVGLCVVLSWASGAPRAVGHEGEPRPITDEERATTTPALAGSLAFARALAKQPPAGLDDARVADLEKLSLHLAAFDRSVCGGQRADTPGDAAVHRSRLERALLSFLGSPGHGLELDFPGDPAAHDLDRPLEIDFGDDTVFLRVVTGDGPVSFSLADFDLTAERTGRPFTATVAAGGTTWLRLNLHHVPAGRNIVHIAFREEGAAEASYFHALTLVAPSPGQIDIDVLDEDGRPSPVFLRLSTHPGGRLREPAGALDLSTQLNDVSLRADLGPGRGYPVGVPGRFGGTYWIVRGGVEMALAHGGWKVRLLHGPEYVPVEDVLRVEAGKWTRRTYRLRRWTDMPARGWYSGDDHVHARLLSSADAARLLAYARAADVHVTNVLEMGDSMRTFYAQRGFGPEFRVNAGDHWLVPGQEDPRSLLGHAIGLNLRSLVRDTDRYLLNDWVAAEIHRQGGLYGHTHLGARACEVHREAALFTPGGIVDFNSIMQTGLGTELYYDLLNLGFRMTASAGSDTPYGGTVGAVRVYAHVGESGSFTPDAWFEALARGRTFVTNGPMVELTVDGALPGDEIVVDRSRPLEVRARSRGLAGSSAPERLRLVRLGEIVEEAEAEPAHPSAEALEVETSLEAGHGFWLAAHAIGRNGSEAHTTPVYVRRRGFRHWNVELAGPLIEKQLRVLDEIEQTVTVAERRDGVGQRNPLDYWNRWAAEQAGAVRERVARAREQYAELRAQLSRERELRANR